MKTVESPTLQILITAGLEDADRAALGLNTALVAQSGGVKSHVFFTLRGTHWACQSTTEDSSRGDILEIIGQLQALGAQLSCCTKCLDRHCEMPTEGDYDRLLADGIRPAGLASVAQRAASGVQSLTF